MVATGRAGALRAWFSDDHLVRNSLFIVLSTGSMGALGFVFWLVAAHLFSATEVGVATSLVTAVILIAYASLLGFNSTFVRVLPTSDDRDAEISTGILLVFAAGVLISGAYIGIVPTFVRQLRFVRNSPLYLSGFILISAFGALNLLTDSVFIAYREAKYNFITDGIVQSVGKLVFPFLLVSAGAFGLFGSIGIAAVVAVLMSLYFMVKVLGYRPHPRVSVDVVRRVFKYSAANYLANGLTILPVMLLPLIAIKVLGSAAAGYYYIAYQVANLLFMVSLAVCQSLFAEGSHEDTEIRHLARRSGLLILGAIVPPGVLICLLASPVMTLFGHGYATHGSTTLVVFVASAPAVALNYWTSSLMRIRHQLAYLVWSNVAYVVAIAVLAVWWAHWGLPWLALSWLISNLISGLIGVVAVGPVFHHHTPAAVLS